MERGLIWLPLLVLFFWLAWAGWNEFRKVEAYRSWAQDFDRAKYDILAVLGQKGDRITWGKPTRQGMVDLQGFSLEDVTAVSVRANGQTVAEDNPPNSGKNIVLWFQLGEDASVAVPFTDLAMAVQWAQALRNLTPHLNDAQTPETPENVS